jgi:hypothetical protein
LFLRGLGCGDEEEEEKEEGGGVPSLNLLQARRLDWWV